MEANRWRDPEGLSWTIVVPVPWRLALSLKLLTRMSPLTRRPIERGTTATPYGLMSPLPGMVEWPGRSTVGSDPRNELNAATTCHVPPNAVIPSPLVWPGAVS